MSRPKRQFEDELSHELFEFEDVPLGTIIQIGSSYVIPKATEKGLAVTVISESGLRCRIRRDLEISDDVLNELKKPM